VSDDSLTADYQCPGETYRISHSVHLGRLTSFYPACRHCPCRDDTVGLGPKQILRLKEIATQVQKQPILHSEGIEDLAIGYPGPSLARTIAIEFARRVAKAAEEGGANPAMIVIASDGRLAVAEIVAAIVEGVRWTGRGTIDLGPASAPSAARAIQHLDAGGGVFVGQSPGALHTAGLKFWLRDEPLSCGELLDGIAAAVSIGSDAALINRPTRSFGTLQRFAAEEIYLDDLRPAYHALRPLRFVLHCSLAPVVGYLEELVRNVACRAIPSDGTNQDLGQQVITAQAHFGISIGDDGERCHVVDERGRPVEPEGLLALITRSLATSAMRGEELRQQTFRRMRERGAAVALDPAGRLWYADGHAPLPDGLRTLTQLLVLLSRNDLAFSAVLDRTSQSG
jgi:hypothetical protein